MAKEGLSYTEIMAQIEATRLFSEEEIRICAAFVGLNIDEEIEIINKELHRRLIFFTTYRGFQILEHICGGFGNEHPTEPQISSVLISQIIAERLFDRLLDSKTKGSKS